MTDGDPYSPALPYLADSVNGPVEPVLYCSIRAEDAPG